MGAAKRPELDWDQLRVDAYSCGVGVNEFWTLTPWELQLVFQAYGKRMEALYELGAWHICFVLNMFSKRRIQPGELLGRGKKSHTFGSAKGMQTYLENKLGPL